VEGRIPDGLDASDQLLTVSAGLDLVLISADEVLVQYGSRSYPSQLLRDTDLTGIIAEIVNRLFDGPITVDELVEGCGPERREDARGFVVDLLNRGILTRVDRSPIDQYLEYTFSGATGLSDRGVTVFGAGPLGIGIVQSLLKHGVRRIALVDNRLTDAQWGRLTFGQEGHESDSQRSSVAAQVRLAAAGQDQVRALQVDMDVGGVTTAVGASEFTILAFEQPSLRLTHLVNRVCIQAGQPWLHVTIDGNLGAVGPLFIPVETACYNDYRTLVEAATPSAEMARRYQRHVARRGATSFFPGLPAHADIAAGLASLAAVHFLIREASFAVGRVVTVDFDRMMLDVEDVLKLPRCPACGWERSALQPPFSAEIVTKAGPLRTRAN